MSYWYDVITEFQYHLENHSYLHSYTTFKAYEYVVKFTSSVFQDKFQNS